MLNAGSYTQQGKYCLVLICKVPRVSKFAETERRMVVTRNREREGQGIAVQLGTVSVGENEKVLKLDDGDSYTTM